MHVKAVGHEVAVPVDAVEGKDRQGGRMRPANARTVQLATQGPAHRAAKREPLVEVADDHAGAGQIGVQDVLAHEPLHLIGALANFQTELHVEDVQQRAVMLGAAALFA